MVFAVVSPDVAKPPALESAVPGQNALARFAVAALTKDAVQRILDDQVEKGIQSDTEKQTSK